MTKIFKFSSAKLFKYLIKIYYYYFKFYKKYLIEISNKLLQIFFICFVHYL